MPRDNDQECGIQAVITGVTVTCHRIRRHDGPHASSTYGTRWRDTGEVLPPPGRAGQQHRPARRRAARCGPTTPDHTDNRRCCCEALPA